LTTTGPHLIQLATENQFVLIPIDYQDGNNYALSTVENSDVMKIGFGLFGELTVDNISHNCHTQKTGQCVLFFVLANID